MLDFFYQTASSAESLSDRYFDLIRDDIQAWRAAGCIIATELVLWAVAVNPGPAGCLLHTCLHAFFFQSSAVRSHLARL